jgi:hypothetical protein
VHRALFSVNSEYLDELKNMQRSQERKWALFMVAGGRFARAIVRVSRSEEEGGERRQEEEAGHGGIETQDVSSVY